MRTARLVIHTLVISSLLALLGLRTVAAQGQPPPAPPAVPEVQLALTIADPVLEPGDTLTLLARVDNGSSGAVSPEIELRIPAGLALSAADLPTGTTFNLQTNAVSWYPIVEARGGTAQISLSFVIATADMTQPQQAIVAVLLHNGAQRTVEATFWTGVPPTAAVTLSPTRVAVGQPVQLTAGAAGPGPLQQLWALGDGRIIAAPDPTVVYAHAGTYFITVEVANPLGTTRAQGTLTVFPETVASFTVADPLASVNQPVSFVNLSGGEPPLSYVWDMGDGTVLTSTNPAHAYGAVGTYLVQLTTSNAYGSATTSWELAVGEPPAADFILPETAPAGTQLTLTAVHDGTASAFRWDLGDGTQLEGPEITHAFRNTGAYFVTLTSENGYGTATSGRWINVTAGQWTLFLPTTTIRTSPVTPDAVPGAPLPEQEPLAEDAALPVQLLWYINEARRLHGLPPVGYNYELSIAAQQHTNDMAAFGYTGHTGSDGSLPPERLLRYGYAGEYAGESTAWGFDRAVPVVEFWVNSPDHRHMILNPAATEVGVGFTVDFNAPNVWYWTVEFGTRRPDG